MPGPKQEYAGICHCGELRFIFSTSRPPADWSVRACQCEFCRAQGVLSVSDPDGSLEFQILEPSRLNRYQFGLRTADFLICRTCGVYIGAVITTPNGRFGIINVNTLCAEPDGMTPSHSMDYDAESIEDRVSRRESRWTPVIGVV